MTRRLCSMLAGGTFIAAFALLGGVAAAQTTPQHLVLHTRIVDRNDPAGEIDGILTLDISADGIVQGEYQGQDRAPHPIVGGINGSQIWLDLYRNGTARFNGTLADGKLRAYRLGRGVHGTDTYVLEGTTGSVAP
ncbi:MAG TPA: hypothetical protein VFB22_13495 [Candidatus Baltobacteraceae bacterium]|nr:hypothetical protein [Candidatus Baltobacteraceae bacterium]